MLLDHLAVERIGQWLEVHTVGLVIGQQSLFRLLIPTMPPPIPEVTRIGTAHATQISASLDA